MNKLFKKTICLLLILIMGISNIIPVFASEENVVSEKVKNQSVIEEEKDEPKGEGALTTFIKGSPFLTDAWEKQKLDDEDTIAMSLYMSSYVYPLIDNYKSAFDESSKLGQKGKSASRLIFQNEEKQVAIQSFIDSIISYQSPSLAETDEEEAITNERDLRSEKDSADASPRKITLRELLYGGDNIDEDATYDATKNLLLSSGKYVIGPTSNELVVYDGSNEKQKSLLYIALMKTARSEYTVDFERNLELLLDKPLFMDNFGNICVNGDFAQESVNEFVEDEEELDTEREAQLENVDNYNLGNIIILPNCLNVNIVKRINLYSSFFLNDNLVNIADKEGIYIGDYNFPASKKNNIELVTRLELGYQSKDGELSIWSEKKTEDEEDREDEILDKLDSSNSIKLTEPIYKYGFDLKKEIIFNYRDISGNSTKIKNIFFPKNSSSKYFNSLLNLNGYVNSDKQISIFDKRGVNYFANRNMYLNWLLMVKPFYNSSIQVETEGYYTGDQIDTSEINSSLYIDQNRKVDELVSNLWNKMQNPEEGVDDYFTTVTSILIRIYESLISISFGSSYITTIPIVSTIGNKIKENYHFVLIISIGFLLIMGLSKGSLLKTLVKGLLCLLLIASLPMIYDKAIDIITSLKYVTLEKSINSWILAENIKYKGIDDISQRSESSNFAEMTQAEKLDNTLLYLKSKSPVIINNISNETSSSAQNSTIGSQIINNLLFQNSSNNDKIASFQDLFKRWDMIIPLWDNEERSIAKSLKIENNEISTGKLIRKVAGSDESDDVYSFTKYNNLDTASNEVESYYTLHENTRKGEDSTEEELAFTSFAARDDSEQIIKDTRYKRQMTSQEFNSLYNLNISDDYSVLKEKYTLRQGIKDTFKLHDYFYYLTPLTAAVTSDNKYTAKEDEIDSEGMHDGYTSVLSTYFPVVTNNTVKSDEEDAGEVRINNFNFYDNSKYDSNYGYFILTENVSPYFYTVWYDMLGDLTSQEIAYALMGKVNRDDEGKIINSSVDGVTLTSRDSILMKDSKIIDYLDLKELFTNVVPYMNTVSLGAKTRFKDLAISTSNSSRYKYYGGNKVSWLFEAGWAEDLIKNYGDQIAKANVFSEYQSIHPVESERVDTDFENLIQQFYLELTPLLEELISVADREDVSKSVLLRQMTILSTLKFNSIFGIIGSNLQPKRVITESIPFDSLWVKFLRDQNYVNNSSNFLKMISENETTDKAFLNVLCAFILALCFYYCNITLLIVASLSFVSIIIKAFKNATDIDEDYIPFMVGSVVLIFKVAFLFLAPQFIIQMTLNLDISKDLASSSQLVFIYLIYAFIYIFIANSLTPSLVSPQVGKVHAFGIFNPFAGENDMGGSNLIQKVGGRIGNVGNTIRKVATGTTNPNSINATPVSRMVPTSAFKREEIKKENNKKPTTATNFRNYRNDTASSSYQESFNNKAISDINKAIEADKKAGNSVLKPTISSSQK